MNKSLLIILCVLFFGTLYAQNTTIGDLDKTNSLSDSEKRQGKILLIPFEPKMYLSEIDKKLGVENELDFRQIRNGFRAGLDIQVLNELKKARPSISLLTDTSESMADLALVYKSIGYNYVPVPAVRQAVAKAAQVNNKSKVKNGELVVEMNYDKKFMNASIKNPELLGYLSKKYNADVFVFINELDLKHNPSGEIDIETGSFPREAIVHFTVFNKSGKEIASGISSTGFSPALNDPKKIVFSVFSTIAKDIRGRTTSALSMPSAKSAPLSKPKQ